MTPLHFLYNRLLRAYGPQGWWPINNHYHPGDNTFPRTEEERFEICIGAILTQNTAWTNVNKALTNLRHAHAINPAKILRLSHEQLTTLIKPAGYYNQKATYLKIFALFFEACKDTPTRQALLAIKGIGKETADSILLYAYHKPIFIIDAYTKRILEKHGLLLANASYDEAQTLFHKQLEPDTKLFQEYHALLVAHAKRYYQKRPYGQDDPFA